MSINDSSRYVWKFRKEAVDTRNGSNKAIPALDLLQDLFCITLKIWRLRFRFSLCWVWRDYIYVFAQKGWFIVDNHNTSHREYIDERGRLRLWERQYSKLELNDTVAKHPQRLYLSSVIPTNPYKSSIDNPKVVLERIESYRALKIPKTLPVAGKITRFEWSSLWQEIGDYSQFTHAVEPVLLWVEGLPEPENVNTRWFTVFDPNTHEHCFNAVYSDGKWSLDNYCASGMAEVDRQTWNILDLVGSGAGLILVVAILLYEALILWKGSSLMAQSIWGVTTLASILDFLRFAAPNYLVTALIRFIVAATVVKQPNNTKDQKTGGKKKVNVKSVVAYALIEPLIFDLPGIWALSLLFIKISDPYLGLVIVLWVADVVVNLYAKFKRVYAALSTTPRADDSRVFAAMWTLVRLLTIIYTITLIF